MYIDNDGLWTATDLGSHSIPDVSGCYPQPFKRNMALAGSDTLFLCCPDFIHNLAGTHAANRLSTPWLSRPSMKTEKVLDMNALQHKPGLGGLALVHHFLPGE